MLKSREGSREKAYKSPIYGKYFVPIRYKHMVKSNTSTIGSYGLPIDNENAYMVDSQK